MGRKLQNELKADMMETQQDEKRMLAEALEQKQRSAAYRREKGMGARDTFVEKAFGPQAPGFDAKYHWATTDRRSNSWQTHAESWEKKRGTFNDPALTITR